MEDCCDDGAEVGSCVVVCEGDRGSTANLGSAAAMMMIEQSTT
jgi:hypothetical protein